MARKTLSHYINENNEGELCSIPITSIEIEHNSRKYFDSEKLQELADSIKQYGILEPLIVVASGYNYLLVVGERRYRAALLAGLKNVPVCIKNFSPEEARIVNIIENIQREDLNPYEETSAILEILKIKLNLSEQETIELLRRIKNKTNKDEAFEQIVRQTFEQIGSFAPESFLASRIPLLNLSEPLKEVMAQGKLEYTKALLINKLTIERQIEIIHDTIQNNYSVKTLKLKINQILSIQSTTDPIKERVGAIVKSLSSLDDKKRKKIESLLSKIEGIIKE